MLGLMQRCCHRPHIRWGQCLPTFWLSIELGRLLALIRWVRGGCLKVFRVPGKWCPSSGYWRTLSLPVVTWSPLPRQSWDRRFLGGAGHMLWRRGQGDRRSEKYRKGVCLLCIPSWSWYLPCIEEGYMCWWPNGMVVTQTVMVGGYCAGYCRKWSG